ncbi:MAG: ribonuclease HII [Candidatus Nanoarchaeia archaeon]|jgi:ribonuclease HII
MKILGIDEAGRGALVGPLVIGGFMIDDAKLPSLSEMGVKDSKDLTKIKRRELSAWLKDNGVWKTIQIPAKEIDLCNKVGVNLNQLEINKMINIINELKPDKVFIDCPSHNEQKIKALFEAKVNCEVICECKADANYPIVGAGSIIAKHERDESVRLLEEKYNVIIGAGYPSDERTIEFARQALNNHTLLEYVRHSWETYARIKGESEQRTLSDF